MMDDQSLIDALRWAHEEDIIAAPRALMQSGSPFAHTGILRKHVHPNGVVDYLYRGRYDRTWWDSHAIWNPYADIAWEHEVGTPWPATKRPVVTRHDNDPDADPKPTFDRIRDIHRRWQARPKGA